MQRLILLLWIAVCAVAGALAQTGLNVSELFGERYRNNKNATEIQLNGRDLKGYNLSAYKSLTLVDSPKEAKKIEALLAKDAVNAVDSEVANKKGQLFYAFYRLPDYDYEHRYLLYLNQHANGGNKIILVYMYGMATMQEVKNMLKSK